MFEASLESGSDSLAGVEKSEALRANPYRSRYAGGLASLGTLACEPQTSCVQSMRSPNRELLRITDVIELVQEHVLASV